MEQRIRLTTTTTRPLHKRQNFVRNFKKVIWLSRTERKSLHIPYTANQANTQQAPNPSVYAISTS